MIYPCPDIQGWMSDNKLQWLYNISLQMSSIVEIGSWKGRSTHALLNGCKGPVYAVDHFKGNPDQIGEGLPHYEATQKDIYEDFKKNVGNYPNLFVMKMDSSAASKFFKKELVDMVFIDGCHRYEDIFRDLKIWMPICKYLLCGHDYNEGGVFSALEYWIPNFKIEPDTSIWSWRKCED